MSVSISETAGQVRTTTIGVYMMVMAGLLAYVVFVLFPERMVDDKGVLAWDTSVSFFGLNGTMKSETRLLLLVMAMGAFGSYVHAATSFVSYVGNRSFVASWTWWYLLRPYIGLALAVVSYFVIRGGFLAGGGVASDTSPYGFAAVAGLVGMFSKQATDKLEELFNSLFKVSRESGDSQRGDKLGINRPVTEKMVPLERIALFRLTGPEDQVPLAAIESACGIDRTRYPVLDGADNLVYLIHRSLLKGFVAEWNGSTAPTLADLTGVAELRALVRDAVAFVPRTTSVGEAKASMEATPRCQDVIVTETGQRNEPVLGWLTNVDISRIAQV